MVIREVETDAERRAVQGLLHEAFEVSAGVGEAFTQLYQAVENAHFIVAVENSRVVGHVLLALRTFGVDGVALPGGILAMVVVAPQYRGQGIGRALIQEAERRARNAGALLLHVAGDPRFYMRFGFIPAYVQAKTVIGVGDNKGELEAGFRNADGGDVNDLAAFSQLETPVGSVIADEARWRWVLDTGHPAPLLKCNDRLVGFCAVGDQCLIADGVGFVRGCWDQKTLAIYEAASCDEAGAKVLLKYVRQWACVLKCDNVRLLLPPNNRLVVAAVQDGAVCEVVEDSELQVKLIDIPGLWARCNDLFIKRAKEAALTGRMHLRIGEHKFELNFGSERQIASQEEVFIPEIGFARALLGTDRLVERLGGQDQAERHDMLDTLFPPKIPFFWLSDSL